MAVHLAPRSALERDVTSFDCLAPPVYWWCCCLTVRTHESAFDVVAIVLSITERFHVNFLHDLNGSVLSI